jgi:hypothetical protein
MAHIRNTSTIAQAAAFALFEGLRTAQGLAVAPDETFRLTFLRTLDSASAGLGFTNAGDDALQLRWGHASEAVGENLYVHASCEANGPYVALYLHRDKPTLQCRFRAPSFIAEGGHHLLRERLTFSSHDGRHEEREALVRRLAKAWRIPLEGSWLHIGTWDDADRTWDVEAVRRLVGVTLILEAARTLDPELLQV